MDFKFFDLHSLSSYRTEYKFEIEVRSVESVQCLNDTNFVSEQNVSEIMTISGIGTEDHFMYGLERGQCTLALSALPGGWFIQVFPKSRTGTSSR